MSDNLLQTKVGDAGDVQKFMPQVLSQVGPFSRDVFSWSYGEGSSFVEQNLKGFRKNMDSSCLKGDSRDP